MSKKTDSYKAALAAAERRMVKTSDRINDVRARRARASVIYTTPRASALPKWVQRGCQYYGALGPKRREKLSARAEVARNTFYRLFFV